MSFGYSEENGRQFLVIEKSLNQVVDTVTIGMLENNDIAEILPFYSVQMNSDIDFRYDTTGFISAREKLAGTVNKKDVLGFLKAILNVCATCESYMIDPSQILLNPDYIFVKNGTNQIKFVMLPFLNNEENFFDTLRNMILGLRFDRNEDCSYVAELLQYFQHNNTFVVSQFSNMVKEVESYKNTRMTSTRTSNTSPAGKNVQKKPAVTKTSVPASRKVAEEDVPDEQETVEDKKKGFLFFGKKKNEETKTQKKSTSAFGGVAIPGVEDGGYSKGTVVIPTSTKGIAAQKVELETYEAEEEDFGETELHRKDEEHGRVDKIRSSYKLLRVSTGDVYSITNEVTKIGRKNSVVDICILGNSYVGRLHAILYKNSEGLFIEDNGSANGTYVGDPDSQISGKTRLNVGERFYLGDEEFQIE